MKTIDEQISKAEARIHQLWDGSERRDTNMLELIKQVVEIQKALNDEVKKLKKAKTRKGQK